MAWCHKKLAPAKKFDERSFRVKVVSKTTQVLVACPRGHWNPKRRGKRKCDVSLKAVSVRKKIASGTCPRKYKRV